MKVPEQARSWVLIMLLFAAIAFLIAVNIQQYTWRPHNEEYWFEQYFWPRHAAWWAKTGMWASVGIMAILFHRWKRPG
ncbi:MAG: hypothetical protein AAB410_00080 [Patescibacteria group bacterium]